jgi:multiple sugar transport system permease protein
MAVISTLKSYAGSTKRRNAILGSAAYHLPVIVLSFLMIYPILWMVASSFKGPAEIWKDVSSLIPKQFTLNSYINGWKGFGGISFTTYYVNSFIYAGGATLFQVLSSAIIAFGFARIRFAGRNFWFTCMLLTLMLPGQVLIIPQYILFKQLGWLNTYLPLLVPRLGGSAFFIFMIIQFIRGLPKELDEAAEMDGCSTVGTFFRIILPLIQPAMITAAIFTFYWTWEDFMGPLIYLSNPKMYTLSLALRGFADPGTGTDWGAIFAMASLSLVPVFAIFVFFQKYLVQGISTTGLTGG